MIKVSPNDGEHLGMSPVRFPVGALDIVGWSCLALLGPVQKGRSQVRYEPLGPTTTCCGSTGRSDAILALKAGTPSRARGGCGEVDEARAMN
jgi:hypothetical protein